MKLFQIKFLILFAHKIIFFCFADNLVSIFVPKIVNQAISSMIKLQRNPRFTTINIISSNIKYNEDAIESVLSEVGDDFLIQIESFDKVSSRRKRFFAIFIVDDIKLFIKYCSEFSDEKFRFNGFFLIILRKHANKDIKNIFQVFWDKFIFNVNVLVKAQSSSKAFLITFFPFNGKSCNDVSPTMINEFDGETATWKSEVFFPKKFKNLQQCLIKVGGYNTPPELIVTKLANGSTIYAGLSIDIIKEFALTLNFSFEFKPYQNFLGEIYANKTATGLLNGAYSRDVDFIVGLLSLQASRMQHLSETRALFVDKIILVIPPASLFGSMEKLLLPFEFFTWIALVLTLTSACFVLTFLLFSSDKWRALIIGLNIKNEYLNIWNILLGGSQTRLPGRNFARFLLMSFVMLCLVIRSSYTGSLFHILKNDISSKEIKSISELSEKGYTFLIFPSLADRTKNESLLRRFVAVSEVE